MSIVTNFDKFNVNEEDKEVPAPAPAEDPAAEPAAAPEETSAEETPAEEPKAEEAPKEEVKADEPQAEEQEYYFTWYGWVPSYGDFDQDWMSVKAKSDSEAIEKLSEYKPIQYSKGGVGLDTLNGEKPKGASVGGWEEQEDGSKIAKSYEVDFKNKKFVLNVTTYPKDHFTNPKENPKKNEKQEVEPFFSGDSKSKSVEENIEFENELGLEVKFEKFCDEFRASGKGAKITLTNDDVIVELGFNYPDELAHVAFDIADQCGITSRELSVCAESSGHKSIKICTVNGGPKNWSMLNRYGRR
mgnify:CR=1 FL=1|jgi:hypothetical protein